MIVYRNAGSDVNGALYDNTALGLDYNKGDDIMSRIGKGVNLSLSATYKI
jgi:hypothetical protein